jgi:hypothetical protein
VVSGGLPLHHRVREFERSLVLSFLLHLPLLVYLGAPPVPSTQPAPLKPKSREVRVRFQKSMDPPLKRQLLNEKPAIVQVPKKASAISEWDTSVSRETRIKKSKISASVGAEALGVHPKTWSDVKFPPTKWPAKESRPWAKKPIFDVLEPPPASGGSVTLAVDDEAIDIGPATVLSTKAHALAGFQRRLFEPLGARWRPEVEQRFFRDPRLGTFDATLDLVIDRAGVVRISALSYPSGYAALDESILALELQKWIIPHPPRLLFLRPDGSEKPEVKLTLRFRLAVSN